MNVIIKKLKKIDSTLKCTVHQCAKSHWLRNSVFGAYTIVIFKGFLKLDPYW